MVHYGRHISAELRTALELGNPPGFEGAVCVDCGRRYRLEWDHLDPVANNGPTSFKNLKGRCWSCHQARPIGTARPACSAATADNGTSGKGVTDMTRHESAMPFLVVVDQRLEGDHGCQ